MEMWHCVKCGEKFRMNRKENAMHARLCQGVTEESKRKIGMLLIATGKYDRFVMPLIESARRFAFNGHDLHFFIFSDKDNYPEADDITVIPHEHRPWPYPTLYRYKTFATNADRLRDMDYLYYSDVDMLFVGPVGNEALGERVATLHPGFVGKVGTPERNPKSLAFVPHGTKNRYFAGGFNGGTRDQFLQMARVIDDRIDKDLKKNIIAVWHDESHMNRYFIDNPPTIILDPGYCYGESMKLPYTKRLLALDKNHAEMRS